MQNTVVTVPADKVACLPITVKPQEGDTMYLTYLNDDTLIAAHIADWRAREAMNEVAKTMRLHAISGHKFTVRAAKVVSTTEGSLTIPWDYQITVEVGAEIAKDKT